MDSRQVRELAEALAFVGGDYRDEPRRCGNRRCESTDIVPDYARDGFWCRDCESFTTGHMAAYDQERRMRERAMSGVGAPFAKWLSRDSREEAA